MSDPKSPEETVFEAARQLPTEDERKAYLTEVCADNSDLRHRVEALLEAEQFADDYFKPCGGLIDLGDTALVPGTGQPGDRIGRYKLLQQIGEGGCGVVYMAEQEEPLRRRVALKVIKLGMDTKAVIARFEPDIFTRRHDARNYRMGPNRAPVAHGHTAGSRQLHGMRKPAVLAGRWSKGAAPGGGSNRFPPAVG